MIRTAVLACFSLSLSLSFVPALVTASEQGPPSGAGDYDDLVVLVDDFVAWRDPRGGTTSRSVSCLDSRPRRESTQRKCGQVAREHRGRP